VAEDGLVKFREAGLVDPAGIGELQTASSGLLGKSGPATSSSSISTVHECRAAFLRSSKRMSFSCAKALITAATATVCHCSAAFR